MKSPRLVDTAMQVGSLACVLIGWAQGHKLTQEWAGEVPERVGATSGKQVPPTMLYSSLGCIATPVVLASMLAGLADKHWNHPLKNSPFRDEQNLVKP